MIYEGVWLLTFIAAAVADYDCVCNYNVEEIVRSAPSDSAQTIGYMYEFDCKQNIPIANLDKAWLAVAFEHHLSYVKSGTAVMIQTCQGSPPAEDRVTTTTSTTLAPTTITTSTTGFTTSAATPKLTTNVSTPSTSTTSVTTGTTQTSTQRPTTPTTPLKTTTTKPTTSTIKSTTTTQRPTTTMPQPTTTTRQTTTIKATTMHPPITTSKPTYSTQTFTSTSKTLPSTQQPTTMKFTSTMTSNPSSTTQKMSGTNPCFDLSNHFPGLIKGKLIHFGQNCYEVVTSSVTWLSAEHDCNNKGGHLMHIANAAEQDYIYKYLKTYSSHRVWIGLTDKRNEEKFEWTSGDPITYTHWSPDRYTFIHMLEDCVELDPNNSGFWKDKDCNTVFQAHYGYVCQYKSGASVPVTIAPFVQTAVPVHTMATASTGINGNTHHCRSQNLQHSLSRGTHLAQYGGSCYELLTLQKMTWIHGEQYCESGHGHLAHINSAAEQTFIQSFMKRYLPDHAVWIGLHDRNTEGHYEWTSGNAVTYTNFVRNHLGNFGSRYSENCFAFIPYKNGQWDDVSCGNTNFFGADYGEIHPFLCQFPVASAGSLVG